jgi:hypothetical protein
MLSLPSNFYVYGLYAINRFNKLFYIGKGSKKRIYRHFKEEPQDTHKRRVLNKYQCYPMFILGGITEDFAYALENKLVDLYWTQLTNKMRGGVGGKSGRKVSDRVKQILKSKNSGKTQAKISAALKAHFALSPALKGELNHNFGKTHSYPLNHSKRKIKTNLNFVAYHMWAYEISGLSMAEYVKNKPFTFGTFSDWRFKRFRHLTTAITSVIKKRPKPSKYSLEFKQLAIRLYKKSKLSQEAFSFILGIPRSTLNGFIQSNL